MARIDGKSPPLGPLTQRPSEATPRPVPRGRPADPQARAEL